METAAHREPYESRGSRTDLGAPRGATPLGDSTNLVVRNTRRDGLSLWEAVIRFPPLLAEVPEPAGGRSAPAVLSIVMIDPF